MFGLDDASVCAPETGWLPPPLLCLGLCISLTGNANVLPYKCALYDFLLPLKLLIILLSQVPAYSMSGGNVGGGSDQSDSARRHRRSPLSKECGTTTPPPLSSLHVSVSVSVASAVACATLYQRGSRRWNSKLSHNPRIVAGHFSSR